MILLSCTWRTFINRVFFHLPGYLLVVISAWTIPPLVIHTHAQTIPNLDGEVYLPVVSKQYQQVQRPPAGSSWLSFVNYHRALANLPAVSENQAWNDGDWKHARYIVKNNVLEHTENPGNPWYTAEGLAAAQNSDLMASSSSGTSDEYAIDLWMQGPFHAVGIIDPALLQVGYGSYRENDGGFQMGAGLDVLRGLGQIPGTVIFPVKWPGEGMVTTLTSHSGGEMPNPLTSCPGFTVPTGLPIILQLGGGSVTPSVTTHSFSMDGSPLQHCIFDETSYSNVDGGLQSLGRSVLNSRDAVILIPRNPLIPGKTYQVSITTNGQTYSWSFSVSASALNQPVPAQSQSGSPVP